MAVDSVGGGSTSAGVSFEPVEVEPEVDDPQAADEGAFQPATANGASTFSAAPGPMLDLSGGGQPGSVEAQWSELLARPDAPPEVQAALTALAEAADAAGLDPEPFAALADSLTNEDGTLNLEAIEQLPQELVDAVTQEVAKLATNAAAMEGLQQALGEAGLSGGSLMGGLVGALSGAASAAGAMDSQTMEALDALAERLTASLADQLPPELLSVGKVLLGGLLVGGTMIWGSQLTAAAAGANPAVGVGVGLVCLAIGGVGLVLAIEGLGELTLSAGNFLESPELQEAGELMVSATGFVWSIPERIETFWEDFIEPLQDIELPGF